MSQHYVLRKRSLNNIYCIFRLLKISRFVPEKFNLIKFIKRIKWVTLYELSERGQEKAKKHVLNFDCYR